jgi:hypothetical protein
MIVKQGDLFPTVLTTVRDENGAVVNLTGATNIKFSMRKSRDPSSIKVDQAAGTLVDGPNGKIGYTWVGSDTDTPGTYEGEFRVTPSSGSPFRVPTDGYIAVIVEAKVA